MRVSTVQENIERLKKEITDAVNGPMLPLLKEDGLDVDYLRLASMQVVIPFMPSIIPFFSLQLWPAFLIIKG